MSERRKKVIAAFDFDKTLIDRDSLVPFLFFSTNKPSALYKFFLLVPSFLGYLFKNLSRQQIKEKILSAFFKGQKLEDLKLKGKTYADTVLDSFIKPEALSKLKWHLAQEHTCVLISASVDLYLTPWAYRHGIETVISSQLKVNDEGSVSGKLKGVNCWGTEKRRRFLEVYGPKENYVLYYYGDSRGDLEMLAVADYPFYRKFTGFHENQG